jgi:hypothetical protein
MPVGKSQFAAGFVGLPPGSVNAELAAGRPTRGEGLRKRAQETEGRHPTG